MRVAIDSTLPGRVAELFVARISGRDGLLEVGSLLGSARSGAVESTPKICLPIMLI